MRVPGIRTRLLAAVAGALAFALALGVAGVWLFLTRSLNHDAGAVAKARAAAALSALRVQQGRLVMGEAPDEHAVESPVWVYAGRKVLEAPRAGESVTRTVSGLVGGPTRFADDASTDTRLYAAPVVVGGKRVGTVVAAVSLSPYEQTERTALIAVGSLALLLFVLAVAAAYWLLGASLRPVGQMTRAAAEWSEHSLDRRFGLGEPRDELTRLAATLDSLLERLAASLRREQRFSAELSHELRTPVARMIAETELALRRPRESESYRAALEVVLRSARQVARTIDALVAAAQHEAGLARGTSDAYGPAAEAAGACGPIAAHRGIDVVVERPKAMPRVGVEQDMVERILQPVIENGCRYAASKVRVEMRRNNTAIVYTIEDDGPGLSADEIERVFEPGARGTAARDEDGAGLGLALARRLARGTAGDLEAEPGPGGRFVVRLPAA